MCVCLCVSVCRGSQLLSLSFTAFFEKDVNWNVIVKVDHKATDLRVNVKAQGYAISCQLTCEDTAVNDKQIMSATAVNDIVLGRVPFRLMYLTLFSVFSIKYFIPSFSFLSDIKIKLCQLCYSLDMHGHST